MGGVAPPRGGPGGYVARARRAARRPRRRLPAQYARRRGRVFGDGEPGSDLVAVFPRHGGIQRDRPVSPDCAQGSVHGGRLSLWRPQFRPARRRCRDRSGAAEPRTRRAIGPRRHGRGEVSCARLGRRHRRRCGARSGACGVRTSTVDRLFVRDHGPAQAHRAWTWRHRARAREADGAAQRSRSGRSLSLVFEHGLDHVELPARRPAGGCGGVPLRWESGVARRGGDVALRRRLRRNVSWAAARRFTTPA